MRTWRSVLLGACFLSALLSLPLASFGPEGLRRWWVGRASCTLESGRRGVILHLSLGMQVPRPARGCSIIFFVVCVLGWFALWIDRNLFPRPLDHNLRPRLPDFLRVLSVGVGVTSSVEFAGRRQVRSKGGQKGESQSSSSSFRFVFRSLVVPRRACARRPARPGRGSAHPRYDSSGLSCCVLQKKRTYAANLNAGTGQGTESRLGSRSWGLGLVSSGRSELDVERGDSELLAPHGDVLGGKHSSVGARLVTIGFHLHTTSDTDERLPSGDIGDMDESVVERGEDMDDPEDVLSLPDLRSESHGLLLLSLLSLWRHGCDCSVCVALVPQGGLLLAQVPSGPLSRPFRPIFAKRGGA